MRGASSIPLVDNPADELVAGQGIGRFVAIIGLTVAFAGFLGFVWVMYDAFRNGGPGSSPLDLELVSGVSMLPVGFLAFLFGGIVYGLSGSRTGPRHVTSGFRPRARTR